MVHRIDSLDGSPIAPEKSCRKKLMVKSELHDSGDDSHGSLSKRPKFELSHQFEGGTISEYNPLEEPSPLGLKLKKSPSLLDLIQMRLSQEKSPSLAKTLARKEKNAVDKLKASNFPSSLLKIGTWEYASRYEGDLVAKCYFAKHKLVWEVLDGGLKNKIEIQWSDIMAIKAKYPDNEPETLDVVLARQPLFFREINPQPRKHTLWQATTDFTSGQATIHRQHFLQFPPGTLQRHFEKLMQCDPRLRFLSQQPEIVLDTPYFQPMVSIFGDQNDSDRRFDLKTDNRFSFSGFRDTVSVSGLSSSETENQEKSQGQHPSIPEVFVMEGDVSSKINETRGLSLLNQIKLPGLHPSMSVGDLVNHISDCISEQMRSDNLQCSINEAEKMDILEEISQYLLSDSQTTPVSDEKSIMSRVNSLCCLLQKEPTGAEHFTGYGANVPHSSVGNTHENVPHSSVGNSQEKYSSSKGIRENRTAEELSAVGEGQACPSSGSKDRPSMSRKDSVGELLLNLPRIASLPRFLFSVSEDPSNVGR